MANPTNDTNTHHDAKPSRSEFFVKPALVLQSLHARACARMCVCVCACVCVCVCVCVYVCACVSICVTCVYVCMFVSRACVRVCGWVSEQEMCVCVCVCDCGYECVRGKQLGYCANPQILIMWSFSVSTEVHVHIILDTVPTQVVLAWTVYIYNVYDLTIKDVPFENPQNM